MSFRGWMVLGGFVLLLMVFFFIYLWNLSISASAIYLALGVVIGPLGFGWLCIDLREVGPWFERLTEVAVIVALFMGGLKLRLLLPHSVLGRGLSYRRVGYAGEQFFEYQARISCDL